MRQYDDSSYYEEDYLDDEDTVGFSKIKRRQPKVYQKTNKKKDDRRKSIQARQKEKEREQQNIEDMEWPVD